MILADFALILGSCLKFCGHVIGLKESSAPDSSRLAHRLALPSDNHSDLDPDFASLTAATKQTTPNSIYLLAIAYFDF